LICAQCYDGHQRSEEEEEVQTMFRKVLASLEVKEREGTGQRPMLSYNALSRFWEVEQRECPI
jgi:hypothetical protein